VDKFIQMQVFVAVAETEGFSSGARRLNISPPVATRAIGDLEARLGVKLLTRTTRYVRVTDAGRRYLDDSKRILDELADADESAVGINGDPSGEIAITAPVMFGRLFVLPGVIEYLNRYPKMEVSTLFVDRLVNLLEEGLDIGVRIGELPDSGMRAIPVGRIHRVVCGAPEYFERMGIPLFPEDLLQHTVVSSRTVNLTNDWKFGQDKTVRVKPRLITNTNEAAIDAAINGFGIVRQFSYQVAQEVADGRLNIILSEYESDSLPINILHSEGRRASAKIRNFVDLIVEQLRSDSVLN
jgi:DNA-binding transcriptional LysR family regulator